MNKSYGGINSDVENYKKDLNARINHFDSMVKSYVAIEKSLLPQYITSRIELNIGIALADYVGELRQLTKYHQEVINLLNTNTLILNDLKSKENLSLMDLFSSDYYFKNKLSYIKSYLVMIQDIEENLDLIEQGVTKSCDEKIWKEYPYENLPPVMPAMPGFERHNFLNDPAFFNVFLISFGASLIISTIVYALLNHLTLTAVLSFLKSFATVSATVGEKGALYGSIDLFLSLESENASTNPSPAGVIIAVVIAVAVICSLTYSLIKEHKAKKEIKRANEDAEAHVASTLTWNDKNKVTQKEVQDAIEGACMSALDKKSGMISIVLREMREKRNLLKVDFKELKLNMVNLSNDFDLLFASVVDSYSKEYVKKMELEVIDKLKNKENLKNAYQIYLNEIVSPKGMIKELTNSKLDCFEKKNKVSSFRLFLESLREKSFNYKTPENQNDKIWKQIDMTIKGHLRFIDAKNEKCLYSELKFLDEDII